MPEKPPKNPMVQHIQEQLWLAMKRQNVCQKDIAGGLKRAPATISKALNGDDLGMVLADQIAGFLGLEIAGIGGLTLVPRTYDEPF
jgi:hypothetical protein